MKIGLQTRGSHGDIRPFVAFAAGLQAAGHDVTLAVTCVDSARYDAPAAGLPFRPQTVATPVSADRREPGRIGHALVHRRDPVRQVRITIERRLLPAEEAMFEASDRPCAGNVLVIAHSFLYTLGVAAERHGRPGRAPRRHALPGGFAKDGPDDA